MKTQDEFQFTAEQLVELKDALKVYFMEELDTEIGDLQATLFIDFLNKKIGRHYYNVGILDATKIMKENTDNLILLIKE